MEQHAQILSADASSAPLFLFKNQFAVLRLCVETAVSDEMQHVILFAAEMSLQRAEGGRGHKFERDESAPLQVTERAVEFGALLMKAERFKINRAGNDGEDAEGRLYAQRARTFG